MRYTCKSVESREIHGAAIILIYKFMSTEKMFDFILRPRFEVLTPWPPNNNFSTGDIVFADQFTG